MRLQRRCKVLFRACRRSGTHGAGGVVPRGLLSATLRCAAGAGAFLFFALFPQISPAQAVRANPGFAANSIPRNDDGSTDTAIDLGFTVNFFGATFGSAWVNNNGNITFGGPLAKFTPEGLIGSPLRIIAPFWADVDTRGAGSALVTYGQDTVNGHRAFGANYVNVGYFGSHDDKLNSFQLVLIERADIGPGNFDIEFNYDRILWETGDASGGRSGLGGTSASAGYSNGTGTREGSFEILGSRINSVFLDSNRNALKRRTLNSGIRGRLVFFVRQGAVDCTFATLSLDQLFPWEGGRGTVQVGAPSGCTWTAISNSRFITITSPADGNGSGNDNVEFTVAPNRSSCPRSGTLTVAGQTIVLSQEPHVTLTVTPPALNLSPIGGAFPTRLALRIENIRKPVNWFASVTPVDEQAWRVTVSPSSGTATDQQPSTLLLDLTPGFQPTFGQIATVTVRDTTEGTAVIVPLVILPGGRLLLSQSAFVFRTSEGGPAPSPQTLMLLNSGQGNLKWSVPDGSLNPAPWLSLSSTSGTVAANSIAPSSTTLAVDAAALGPGVYQTLVPISTSGSVSDTELVAVTLQVVPAATASAAEILPNGMVFVAQQGGPAPAAQNLAVSNVGGAELTFQLTPSTFSGNGWLNVSAADGSAGAALVQVTANPAGLAPGVYRGTITATFSAGDAQEVQVALVVIPPPGRTLFGSTNCTPQGIDLISATIGNGGSLPLSFARPLLAKVVDTCGGAVNNATVLVDISDSANTKIVLQPMGNGLFSGVWTPVEEGSGVPVKLIALHPSFGSVQRSFSVSIATAPGEVTLPAIAADGIAEAAGCTLQQPLAPGSIILVTGTQLAPSDASSTAAPLERQLAGASLRIGGEDVPLFWVSSGQIQAQVPFTAKPWQTVPVVVIVNGQISAPQNPLIVPVQPAIFEADGIAAAMDGQGNPITPQNPARTGDTLQLTVNGLGVVDPAVEAGAASPSSSTVRSRVRVSIGGFEVPVVSQGLAPGSVGLYLVKVLLPSTMTAGDEVPIIIQQEAFSSNPITPVVIPVRRP